MTEADTEAALVAAVIASPDDDTARLVYADFLDEKTEPDPERAEFIRLQIEFHIRTVVEPRTLNWFMNEVTREHTSKMPKLQRGGNSDIRLSEVQREAYRRYKSYLERVKYLQDRCAQLHRKNRHKWLKITCPTCQGDGWYVQIPLTGPTSTPCRACGSTGDIGGLRNLRSHREDEAFDNGDTDSTIAFVRGFPDRVHVPFHDVFQRTSYTAGHGTRSDLITRATPWALRVVAHHPIRQIYTSQRSLLVDGVWTWYSGEPFDSRPNFEDHHWLVQEVWDELEGASTVFGYQLLKGYPTQLAANDALARAVVIALRKWPKEDT